MFPFFKRNFCSVSQVLLFRPSSSCSPTIARGCFHRKEIIKTSTRDNQGELIRNHDRVWGKLIDFPCSDTPCIPDKKKFLNFREKVWNWEKSLSRPGKIDFKCSHRTIARGNPWNCYNDCLWPWGWKGARAERLQFIETWWNGFRGDFEFWWIRFFGEIVASSRILVRRLTENV